MKYEVPLIAEQKQVSNKGGTICSHWNSYILSIKLRTKSNIDIVQKINKCICHFLTRP